MSETKTASSQNGDNAKKHFCTCPVTQCSRHPSNHEQGCDLCIKDNIEKGKMPACMFKVAHDDISDIKDFTIKGFVDFYIKVNKK